MIPGGSVHLIAFFQQQLSQVSSVLTRDSGNQRSLLLFNVRFQTKLVRVIQLFPRYRTIVQLPPFGLCYEGFADVTRGAKDPDHLISLQLAVCC